MALPAGWDVYTGATATAQGTIATFGVASYAAGSNTWDNYHRQIHESGFILFLRKPL